MDEREFYSVIGEMSEGVQTLIKRGKPVSPADLQQLLDAVAAKAQPKLDSVQVARLLAPCLLAEMPSPHQLEKTGQDVMALFQREMRLAIQHGKAEISQVAAELGRTADRFPRQVSVRGEMAGFTSIKAAGIFLGLLLASFIMIAAAYWHLGNQEANLAQVQAQLQQIRRQEQLFRAKRRDLLQDYPALAYRYFPYPGDPKPAPRPKLGQRK